MIVSLKSRAIAAFIAIKTGKDPVAKVSGFDFAADEQGESLISGKTVDQWENEFVLSDFSKFNQLIRNLGDQQRGAR